MAAKSDTSNAPYIENYPPLKAWLDKIGARCMWQTGIGGTRAKPTGFVECWLAQRPFIVVVRANQSGWEIYTDGDKVRIDETLADAEERLGLTIKSWCVDPRHATPCPAESCTACVDDCAAEHRDFRGTRHEAMKKLIDNGGGQ